MRDELFWDDKLELVYTMYDKLEPEYLDSLEYFYDPVCYDDMSTEGVTFLYRNDDESADLLVLWKDDRIVMAHRIVRNNNQ